MEGEAACLSLHPLLANANGSDSCRGRAGIVSQILLPDVGRELEAGELT